MTRVNLNDGTVTPPLSERDRHMQIIRELVEELEIALATAQARIEALEKEVADVRTLDENCSLIDLQQWAGPSWSLETGNADIGTRRFVEPTPSEARSKAADWVREQQKSGKP